MAIRKANIRIVAPVSLAVAAFCIGAVVADDVADKPIREARQTVLLERFGEEGIDANGDGVLTREEVRGFFIDQWAVAPTGQRDGIRRPRGERGMHRPMGERGMRGPRGERGHGGWQVRNVGGMLARLESLRSETPPEGFSLERFPNADTDGDGQLSDAEWTEFSGEMRDRMLARLATMFPEMDADEDGKISDTEWIAIRAQVRERCLARNPGADTDGDGVLSDQEYEAYRTVRMQERRTRMLERFPEADLDGDGVLSDEEMSAFRGGRRGFPAEKGKGHHRGGGRGHRGPIDH